MNQSHPFNLRSLCSTLCLLAAAAYVVPLVGCGGPSAENASQTGGEQEAGDDHDHDGDHDHDHDHEGDHEGDHAGHDHHDHPPHGPHGGHMLSLSGELGSVEWDENGDDDQVVIYADAEQAEAIEKVEMRYQLEGQEPKSFELAPDPSLGEHAYQVKSPELLTAIHVGDAAGVTLVVTTAEGEQTAPVRHFEH